MGFRIRPTRCGRWPACLLAIALRAVPELELVFVGMQVRTSGAVQGIEVR